MDRIAQYLKAQMNAQGFVNVSQALIDLRVNSICLTAVASEMGLEFSSIKRVTVLVASKAI